MTYDPRGWFKQPEPKPFPTTEGYSDCAEINHVFTITSYDTPTGYRVTATETDVDSRGYELHAFSPSRRGS